MIIVHGNYRIKHSEGLVLFDLYKIRTFQSGNTPGKQVDVALGYGITFERAIHAIALDINADETGTASLDEFIQSYAKITESLKEEVKKYCIPKGE